LDIIWTLKPFDELTPAELYALLRLRSEVFVVEQNCVFLDMDNKDQVSWHLMGWNGCTLVAECRLLPAGAAYAEPSIARVITSLSVRRTGIGRELMRRSLEAAHRLFRAVPLRIGAQYYLKSFYKSFGFQQAGGVYVEDGIEHIEMLRP